LIPQEETGREFIPSYNYFDTRSEVGNAQMTLSEYKQRIEPIINEYFSSADVEELQRSVVELEAIEYSYELVKRSISMSLDKGDKERELVSRMLSFCYPDTLSSNMIGKGFERLLELGDELEKDCPKAKEMLSTFLARAVVDEVIPPSFIADGVVCNLGGEIVDHTKRMLSRDHAGAKLERVWGPGDGRPVEDLKVAVDQLLQEYLISGSQLEANRCIKELHASHFHHEIVKRAITCALDKSPEQQVSMSNLLAYIVNEGTVSQQQCLKGIERIFGIMSDLVLDTPSANTLVQAFVERAVRDSVLPTSVFSKAE
jgi:programmed cell death protein 4